MGSEFTSDVRKETEKETFEYIKNINNPSMRRKMLLTKPDKYPI